MTRLRVTIVIYGYILSDKLRFILCRPKLHLVLQSVPGGGGGGGGGFENNKSLHTCGGGGGFENNKSLRTCYKNFGTRDQSLSLKLIRSPARRLLITYM